MWKWNSYALSSGTFPKGSRPSLDAQGLQQPRGSREHRHYVQRVLSVSDWSSGFDRCCLLQTARLACEIHPVGLAIGTCRFEKDYLSAQDSETLPVRHRQEDGPPNCGASLGAAILGYPRPADKTESATKVWRFESSA